jgi:hypothetical protein
MHNKLFSIILCASILTGCSSSSSISSSSVSSSNSSSDSEETSDIIPSLSISNTWDTDNIHYQQISLQIENDSKKNIKTWQIQLKYAENSTLSQNWNCTVNDTWLVTPADYNAEIDVGSSASDMGIIAGAGSSDTLP